MQQMGDSPQYRAWFDSYVAWLANFQKLSADEQRTQIVEELSVVHLLVPHFQEFGFKCHAQQT